MESVHLPQKRYYRQRAHSNPIADHNLDLYVLKLCTFQFKYPYYLFTYLQSVHMILYKHKNSKINMKMNGMFKRKIQNLLLVEL